MSMIWDHLSKDESMWSLLEDMGFEEYSSVPSWAEDLATQLIEFGWKKK